MKQILQLLLILLVLVIAYLAYAVKSSQESPGLKPYQSSITLAPPAAGPEQA